MSVTIQISGISEHLYSRLTAQAATAGTSLSDFLLAELHLIAHRPDDSKKPSMEEMRRRLERQTPVKLSVSSADAVRMARGEIP